MNIEKKKKRLKLLETRLSKMQIEKDLALKEVREILLEDEGESDRDISAQRNIIQGHNSEIRSYKEAIEKKIEEINSYEHEEDIENIDIELNEKIIERSEQKKYCIGKIKELFGMIEIFMSDDQFLLYAGSMLYSFKEDGTGIVSSRGELLKAIVEAFSYTMNRIKGSPSIVSSPEELKRKRIDIKSELLTNIHNSHEQANKSLLETAEKRKNELLNKKIIHNPVKRKVTIKTHKNIIGEKND